MNTLKKLFNFFNDETPYYAASLSFFTIFAILPLIALLIVVISSLPIFSQYLDSIILYILDFINPARSSELATVVNLFLKNVDKLGDIGIFYMLFVFTMFFKDYEYIINKIYGTSSRAIYKLFFMYLGFLILIPLVFVLFMLISNIPILSFSVQFLAFLFMWILFIVLFILSANKHISIYSASISSIITLVMLSIAKSLFGYYVVLNTTYTTIYGSFSIALFFFLWIYVSWNIYLYGTKLCALLNQGELINES